jgi:predicted TIM-barrel fold metal-dependent hydrolase
MESGSGWPAFWIDRLHEHAEVLGWLVNPPIKRLPAEVFRDQCVVTAEGEDRMAPVTQSFYGDEKVLWASDYPHFDVEPPYVTEMQERRDLTPAQKDGIFRRAALRFYKLDEDAIARAGRKRRGDASPSRKPSAGERA